MADIDDVETALVGLIAGAVYPNGISQPSAIVAGARIYAGWPQAAKLDADLLLGRDGPDSDKVVNISVFPRDTERNTTRYAREWRPTATPLLSLTSTVSGQQVTFGGTVSLPQFVTVLARGKAYSYALQAGDTLNSIAAALAALISADQAASSVGPVLTIPGVWELVVNHGTMATVGRIVRTQMKQFSIDIWAPTPALRVATARLVDAKLAAIGFLQYADGSSGRINRAMSADIDEGQKELCYRRSFIEWCEWHTIETQQAPQITSISEAIQAGVTPDQQPPVNVTYGGAA